MLHLVLPITSVSAVQVTSTQQLHSILDFYTSEFSCFFFKQSELDFSKLAPVGPRSCLVYQAVDKKGEKGPTARKTDGRLQIWIHIIAD